eukprot:COSAG02_NODE_204_length_29210_cov_36.596579_21_plen_749_part_00
MCWFRLPHAVLCLQVFDADENTSADDLIAGVEIPLANIVESHDCSFTGWFTLTPLSEESTAGTGSNISPSALMEMGGDILEGSGFSRLNATIGTVGDLASDALGSMTGVAENTLGSMAGATGLTRKFGEIKVEINIQIETLDSKLFNKLDLDGDGALNFSELRDAVRLLYPKAGWDDSLWDAFCEEYGADAMKGFELRHFMALRVAMRDMNEPESPASPADKRTAVAAAKATKDKQEVAQVGSAEAEGIRDEEEARIGDEEKEEDEEGEEEEPGIGGMGQTAEGQATDTAAEAATVTAAAVAAAAEVVSKAQVERERLLAEEGQGAAAARAEVEANEEIVQAAATATAEAEAEQARLAAAIAEAEVETVQAASAASAAAAAAAATAAAAAATAAVEAEAEAEAEVEAEAEGTAVKQQMEVVAEGAALAAAIEVKSDGSMWCKRCSANFAGTICDAGHSNMWYRARGANHAELQPKLDPALVPRDRVETPVESHIDDLRHHRRKLLEHVATQHAGSIERLTEWSHEREASQAAWERQQRSACGTATAAATQTNTTASPWKTEASWKDVTARRAARRRLQYGQLVDGDDRAVRSGSGLISLWRTQAAPLSPPAPPPLSPRSHVTVFGELNAALNLFSFGSEGDSTKQTKSISGNGDTFDEELAVLIRHVLKDLNQWRPDHPKAWLECYFLRECKPAADAKPTQGVRGPFGSWLTATGTGRLLETGCRQLAVLGIARNSRLQWLSEYMRTA